MAMKTYHYFVMTSSHICQQSPVVDYGTTLHRTSYQKQLFGFQLKENQGLNFAIPFEE